MNGLLRRLPTNHPITLTTTRQMGTGPRGARGHGWLQKYRSNRGGRHLQGRYHYRDIAALTATNHQVFAMNNATTQNEVYLDISVGDEPPRRILIELASSLLPVTCANFRNLCRDASYVRSGVYKIEKSVGLCMGDIIYNNGMSGRCHPDVASKASPYSFRDEGFYLSHVEAGMVSMLSPGVHRNDSRFLITTGDAPHLDGRFVAFGRVKAECISVVDDVVNGVFTKRGRPTVDITVVGSGVLV